MKISKLFHWLYASIMMLPLVVIPIFAIYSQRHEINDYVIEKEIVKDVNFNQLVINGKPTDLTYYSVLDNNNISLDNGLNISVGANGNNRYFVLAYNQGVISDNDNVKLFKFSYTSSALSYFGVTDSSGNFYAVSDNDFLISSYLDVLRFQFVFENQVDTNEVKFFNFQIFDLTQMFGSGNEPTIEQFNEWYPNSYYEYTTGRKELLYTGQYDTLNDIDIGSQFIYQLYNVTNNYFNIKDWMHFDGLFDWFLLNIFNASNSLIIPIIFNLIVYWLVISFLWLIFDILMYVPSMIHKMLDKARME